MINVRIERLFKNILSNTDGVVYNQFIQFCDRIRTGFFFLAINFPLPLISTTFTFTTLNLEFLFRLSMVLETLSGMQRVLSFL